MSTVAAMASSYSSLNPDAPLFIPAAYRQVEDFSPEWWELVKTTAWFRDHWFRQNHRHHHLLHDADDAFTAADDDVDVDVAALLPDDLDMVGTDDLFYAPDVHQAHQAAKPAPLLPGYDLDVLRALSLSSPGPAAAAVNTAPSPSPRAMQQHQQQQQQQQQHRHADKPTWHAAGARAAARRGIHQPR